METHEVRFSVVISVLLLIGHPDMLVVSAY